jgi:thymidylate kinase
MALVPAAVFYLRIQSPQQLVERVLTSGRGFDYWESGMDLHLGEDFYDSFVAYQTRMLKVFDRMSAEFGFHVLNASRSVRSVASDLRRAVAKVVDESSRSDETAISTQPTDKAPSSLVPLRLADIKKKALP